MLTKTRGRATRRVERQGVKPLNERQKRQVKNLIGHKKDVKYFDQESNANSISTAGTIFGGHVIPAQGVTESQRVADDIQMNSIDLKYSIVGADATNIIRVIVFQWNDNNAVNSPTVAKVLESVVTTPWLANINQSYQQAGTLSILYDRMHACSLNGDDAIVVRTKLFGRRLGRKKIQFTAASTSGWNQFYTLVISDSAAVTHPSYSYSLRGLYTDS